MTQRWWDPSGPAVDLLTPGGDRHLDTANALFALHRAGAAALNAAAVTPMIDESVISKAADSARAAYAEPVCETLGAVLGDPTYAGLFVRDIADEAEASALGVYRSCVSKGVPPPIAAQRAALVYGVPPAHLGNYQAVAANPISKDIAVLDAADRALFGWATAASANELEQISKAESSAARREAVEDQPRGQRGQWGRRDLAETAERTANPASIDGMSVTDWLNAQTEQEAEEPAEAPARQARTARTARVARQARQARVAAAPQAVRRPAQRQRGRRVAQMAPQTRKLAQRDAARELAVAEAQPAQRQTRHGAVPVSTPRGTSAMPLLNDDTTYILPLEEWSDLERAARTEGKGPHEQNAVYITGEALTRHAHIGAFTGSDRHDEIADDIADEYRFNGSFQEIPDDVVIPVPQHVVDELAKAGNPVQADLMLEDSKRRYLSDYLDDNPEEYRDVNIAEEVANISYLPEYHTGEMLFVWRPPNGRSKSRPVRIIAEVTIDSRNARGEIDPGTRHGESTVTIDPHSLLRVDRSKPHYENLTYDSDRRVGRLQIHAQVADKFHKAESSAARRAASAEQPRDGGRWGARTDEQDAHDRLSEQLAGTRERALRQPRAARTARTARTAQRQATAALIPTRSPKRDAAVRQTLRRQLSPITLRQMSLRQELPSADAAPFADNEAYTIVGNDVMERHLGVGSQAMVVDHNLDAARTDRLRSMEFYAGDDALEEVNRHTYTDEINTKLVLKKSYAVSPASEMRFMNDYQHAAGRLGVSRFTMQRYFEGDQLRIKVKVYDVTDRSEPAVNVLRWNSPDPDRKHTLHFEGTRRVLSPDQVSRQLTIEWHAVVQGTHGPSVGGNVANPILNWWAINETEQ